MGNNLVLDESTILQNLQAVQDKNGLEVLGALAGDALDFDIEMETGHRQDLRLPAHDLRARQGLQLHQVRHPRAERGDQGRRHHQHQADAPALPRPLPGAAVRLLGLLRQVGRGGAGLRHQHQRADHGHDDRLDPWQRELAHHPPDPRQAEWPAADRLPEGHAPGRDHGRAAEHGVAALAVVHRGTRPDRHPAVLGHAPQAAQRRLPARPGRRARPRARSSRSSSPRSPSRARTRRPTSRSSRSSATRGRPSSSSPSAPPTAL